MQLLTDGHGDASARRQPQRPGDSPTREGDQAAAVLHPCDGDTTLPTHKGNQAAAALHPCAKTAHVNILLIFDREIADVLL